MVVKKTFLEQWGWGCYPAGYDRAVHGPYDPARYYGPKDANFGEVKVSELTKWISRRDKSPRAFTALVSRGLHRWCDKFIAPRNSGIAPYVQVVVFASMVFYLGQYNTLRHHKNYKHHW